MNPLPFENPMKYAPAEAKSGQRIMNFKEATYLGKETYKLIPGIITLSSPPKSTVDYIFNYPAYIDENGAEVEQFGMVMIPYPELFVNAGNNGQALPIKTGHNVLTLKAREDIEKIGYVMDGRLEFVFTIFNFRTGTMVIGNSPPKMKLGP